MTQQQQQQQQPRSNLPSLENGPIPLKPLRDAVVNTFLGIVEKIVGQKELVIDPTLLHVIELYTDVPTLKDKGVVTFIQLSTDTLPPVGANITRIFLVRDALDTCIQVADQIKDSRIFESAGVMGDVVLEQLPIGFIPLDGDVLSLEQPNAIQQVLTKQTGAAYYTARALMQWQQQYGQFSVVKGKGTNAVRVHEYMLQMSNDASYNVTANIGATRVAPAAQSSMLGGSFNGPRACIVVDRCVDMVTPLMTQTTYEGLLDEVFGIKGSVIKIPQKTQQQPINQQQQPQQHIATSSSAPQGGAGGVEKHCLSSSDGVLAELRDMHIQQVPPCIREKALSLQKEYTGTVQVTGGSSITDLAQFTKKLQLVPLVQRHLSLVEQISTWWTQGDVSNQARIEHEMLSCSTLGSTQVEQASVQYILELMWLGEPLQRVLRLACLLCLTLNGITKRNLDDIRRNVLLAYGHHHIPTMAALTRAELYSTRTDVAAREPWSRARAAHALINDAATSGELALSDLAGESYGYAYGGYSPLSVKLVEAAVHGVLEGGGGGGGGVGGGPQFDVTWKVQEDGSIVSVDNSKAQVWSSMAGQYDAGAKPTVLVVFVGGITSAEISCFRWLTKQSSCPVRFIVATSVVQGGQGIMDAMIDPLTSRIDSAVAQYGVEQVGGG